MLQVIDRIVKTTELIPSERVMLIVLLRLAKRKPTVSIAQKELAAITGFGENTVNHVVRGLITKGYIREERATFGYNTAKIYAFTEKTHGK